jgi:hypothetical protein
MQRTLTIRMTLALVAALALLAAFASASASAAGRPPCTNIAYLATAIACGQNSSPASEAVHPARKAHARISSHRKKPADPAPCANIFTGNKPPCL